MNDSVGGSGPSAAHEQQMSSTCATNEQDPGHAALARRKKNARPRGSFKAQRRLALSPLRNWPCRAHLAVRRLSDVTEELARSEASRREATARWLDAASQLGGDRNGASAALGAQQLERHVTGGSGAHGGGGMPMGMASHREEWGGGEGEGWQGRRRAMSGGGPQQMAPPPAPAKARGRSDAGSGFLPQDPRQSERGADDAAPFDAEVARVVERRYNQGADGGVPGALQPHSRPGSSLRQGGAGPYSYAQPYGQSYGQSYGQPPLAEEISLDDASNSQQGHGGPGGGSYSQHPPRPPSRDGGRERGARERERERERDGDPGGFAAAQYGAPPQKWPSRESTHGGSRWGGEEGDGEEEPARRLRCVCPGSAAGRRLKAGGMYCLQCRCLLLPAAACCCLLLPAAAACCCCWYLHLRYCAPLLISALQGQRGSQKSLHCAAH